MSPVTERLPTCSTGPRPTRRSGPGAVRAGRAVRRSLPIADRRGGRVVLNVGLVIFGAGAVTCAAAPTAELFILGRVLTGVGEAAFDIALVVLVAMHIPADLRPKLFAAYSTAWLLPSAFGPQLAAWIYDALTWRAVFWVIAATVPILGLVLWAALSGRREDAPREVPLQVPIRYAWIAFAAGCGVVCTTWVAERLGLELWQSVLLASGFHR